MSTIFADSRMEVGKYRHMDINRFNVVLEKFSFALVVQPSDVHAKSYPHRGTRGGGGGRLIELPRWVFDMLQYFETILPSVESL